MHRMQHSLELHRISCFLIVWHLLSPLYIPVTSNSIHRPYSSTLLSALIFVFFINQLALEFELRGKGIHVQVNST